MSIIRSIPMPRFSRFCVTAILFFASVGVWFFGFSSSNSTKKPLTEDHTSPPEIGGEQFPTDDGALAPNCREVVPAFMGLGDLPGGIFCSSARCVSQDGSTVVGYSIAEQGMEAFRWTREQRMVGLGFLEAHGVSEHGRVVVGCRLHAGRSEAVSWTQHGGTFQLEVPAEFQTPQAYATSSNGSVIVGSVESDNREEAFYWTESEPAVHLLGFLPGGQNSAAYAVSADGLVVVGRSETGKGQEAFRWTRVGGMVGLGTLPGETFSEARAVSCDGSVVVGRGTSEAFVWTEQDGMVSLGQTPGAPPGGDCLSIANAVSADGSVIVGKGWTKSNYRAAIWDATHAMRTVRDVLEEQVGLSENLSGWKLMAANAISADGRVVVGLGINPDGNLEAWIARLPDSPEENNATMNLAGRAPAVGVDPAQ